MDIDNQNELHKDGQNNVVDAEDRISKLPDSLLHCILSSNIDTKCVVQTSVVSKRWKHIWTSIPTLDFRYDHWNWREPPSLSEINQFMDFVDRTLHLHDASSNIQKFSLFSNVNMNASRVHSWIENITRRNIEKFYLSLDQVEALSIPSSLFTCASLTKLELDAGLYNIRFSENISSPKLKVLTLRNVLFTNGHWNEQLFSNCLALEELRLFDCNWFEVGKFYISAPTLKLLKIVNNASGDDGLRDCHLKIHSPSLVSLVYCGSVAKDYDLSSIPTLENAVVEFYLQKSRTKGRRRRKIEGLGAAVTRLLRALSNVRCLEISQTVKVLSADLIKNLPTFHNLGKLSLLNGAATDKIIFALLKAAPNMRRLEFIHTDNSLLPSIDDDDKEYGETEDLFPHLQSVGFLRFSGAAWELRWVELILKNAKSLQTMTIAHGYGTRYSNANGIEVLMSELSSLPTASGGCVFNIVKSVW